MIDALITALNGANVGLDMAKRAVSARDQRLIETAMDDMTDKLRLAYAAALEAAQDALKLAQEARALDQRVAALERETEQLKAKAQDRERYRLVQLGRGSFAYGLKEVEPQGEPLHYCCQACMDKGQKVVLQAGGGYGSLQCPACKAQGWSPEMATAAAEGMDRLTRSLRP